MTALDGWENFYVIAGSSAGALIGLQFVVMTLLAAAFRASAVMNLKKQPGTAQCKVRELISAAERDRFWIEREIEILSPTVVVCCGTFRVVARVLGGFDSVGGAARCHLRNGMLWVDHWHPCALRGAAAKYDRLMDACEAFMGRETSE